MLFFLSFFQNSEASCGSEPILENLTCSSVLTGKIDFNQSSLLNDYYCDIHNMTLQKNTCYAATAAGYDCYWSPGVFAMTLIPIHMRSIIGCGIKDLAKMYTPLFVNKMVPSPFESTI